MESDHLPKIATTGLMMALDAHKVAWGQLQAFTAMEQISLFAIFYVAMDMLIKRITMRRHVMTRTILLKTDATLHARLKKVGFAHLEEHAKRSVKMVCQSELKNVIQARIQDAMNSVQDLILSINVLIQIESLPLLAA